ncbi:2TM domain-containing protein, partial [Algibacter miyuki]
MNICELENHVDELKGFYYSLITYCLVIPFLAYVNYKTF